MPRKCSEMMEGNGLLVRAHFGPSESSPKLGNVKRRKPCKTLRQGAGKYSANQHDRNPSPDSGSAYGALTSPNFLLLPCNLTSTSSVQLNPPCVLFPRLSVANRAAKSVSYPQTRKFLNPRVGVRVPSPANSVRVHCDLPFRFVKDTARPDFREPASPDERLPVREHPGDCGGPCPLCAVEYPECGRRLVE